MIATAKGVTSDRMLADRSPMTRLQHLGMLSLDSPILALFNDSF